MKSRLARLLCVGCFVFACGGDSSEPTGPSGNGAIRVSNTSTARSVVEVNISRCDIAVWGDNRIGSPITPGRSVEIQLAPNCHDARVFLDNTQSFEFFDLLIQAGRVETITVFDL